MTSKFPESAWQMNNKSSLNCNILTFTPLFPIAIPFSVPLTFACLTKLASPPTIINNNKKKIKGSPCFNP